jgi:hypothetical protein
MSNPKNAYLSIKLYKSLKIYYVITLYKQTHMISNEIF